MSGNTYSITIARPKNEVFEYMDDVHSEREWQPAIRAAHVEPEGPTGVGTKKHYTSEFLGRKVKNTYIVKELEAESRVVYETTPQSAVQGLVTFTWEAVDEGTLVTMSINGVGKGMLRFVPRGALDRFYQNEIEATLKRLKARLESAD